jgi:hypothetical protein
MEAVHKTNITNPNIITLKEPNRLQQYRRVLFINVPNLHPSDYRYVNVQVRCTLC